MWYSQIALECIDKFEEEFKNQNGRSKTREKQQQDKNSKPTLQSIDEGEGNLRISRCLPDTDVAFRFDKHESLLELFK